MIHVIGMPLWNRLYVPSGSLINRISPGSHSVPGSSPTRVLTFVTLPPSISTTPIFKVTPSMTILWAASFLFPRVIWT